MAIVTDLKILRKKSLATTVSACRDGNMFENLERELELSVVPGVGLSAIQIGAPIRACVIKSSKGEILRMVNPVISEMSVPTVVDGEGCLSLPGVHVRTSRFNQCLVEWTNYDSGVDICRYFYALDAFCIQHEVDHMDGIIMTDRKMGKLGRNDLCNCGSGKKYKKCCGK